MENNDRQIELKFQRFFTVNFPKMCIRDRYGSANLFRSECVDAESKGDDGFKTVNLHAAFRCV